MMNRIALCVALSVNFILSACSHVESTAPFPKKVRFDQDIAPILEERCLVCHYQSNAANSGGLNLETRQLAFSTGRNAPVIVPGKPEESPLVAALFAREIHPVFMPPVAHRLSDSQLELIQDWIRQGADWPMSSEGTLSSPGGSSR